MSVVVETSIGDFTVDLFTKERPKACFNFLKLCKIRYYNYNLFFEIKKDYTARSGDPTNQGSGGESIYWFDESRSHRKKYFSAEQLPFIKHTKVGQVSMINNGKQKHGSQFFITLAKDLDYLDKQGHTIFGQVVEGLEVLEALNRTLIDDKDCPMKDICISHTVILHDPYADPPYLKTLLRKPSPDLPDYLVNSKRVGIYDDLNEDEGRSAEEIEAEREAKEAQEKAIVLEMLGDLPSADAKPPENVLFICRLNPITEEGDLERIFSRFGKINSVKIIKDPKTGQSLQYGFIEYDEKDDCERAYLKMNNVLLDDRRIHVDFSQSVAKSSKMSYDMRAFGDFGWQFVNAGEQYRMLEAVSKEDALMMCGLFKQATMGDCLVEEAKKSEVENRQREEWLKYKGMDTFDAMQLYIEKVRELAQVYNERKPAA